MRNLFVRIRIFPSTGKIKNEEKHWFLLFCDFFMTFIFEKWWNKQSQRYPDPHPDPYQNVTDPEHWLVIRIRIGSQIRIRINVMQPRRPQRWQWIRKDFSPTGNDRYFFHFNYCWPKSSLLPNKINQPAVSRIWDVYPGSEFFPSRLPDPH
jgi:hypothetical protein